MRVEHGYAGTVLDVDLTAGTVTRTPLEPALCRDYLGGIGFNARVLYDQVPPGTDALAPANILVFSAGTLVGSLFPTASRTEASAKSPLTGLFGTSNSGMFFGIRLKAAGYDALVLRGKAKTPVYLAIEDDRVEIRPADDLWGLDSWQTIEVLEQRHRDCEVAAIGPAGENLVRFACIENGRYDAWARTGLGAVMGSKHLKAVAVRGTGSLRPRDPQGLLQVARQARELIMSSPFYVPFRDYGSMNAAIPYGNWNALAAHNFTLGCRPGWKEEFARARVEEHTRRHVACQSCIIACAHWVEVADGPYQGLRMKDMEVTPTVSFGSQLGLSLTSSVKAAELNQRYGMDMVSVAGVAGMAIELYRRGVLTRDDVGYDLDFGDDDAVFRLFDDIAHRRGIGALLAEGVKRAAEQLPEEARDAAIHVKGLEIPMIDPRGRWSTWTLGIITNLRGGDHLRCRNPVENLRFNLRDERMQVERFGFDRTMYERLDMPEELKRQAIDLESDSVDIAVMSRWAEDLINLFNAVGICIRPPVMNRVGPRLVAEACSVFTDFDFTADQVALAAERTWNLIKLFNLREGERPEDSSFPRRFYREAAGGQALDESKVAAVLARYYQVRGWDPASGRPSEEKLRELGIQP
ncbi:MAG: aldehyde ferredoxin oxidoreductase family protein [Syntrophomonadaceae bacterium]|nr:aldehyde ferredoxin oxidoreductase family protein [Syntrophomonadaceae bacterium]